MTVAVLWLAEEFLTTPFESSGIGIALSLLGFSPSQW
jgi:hypothetical protein